MSSMRLWSGSVGAPSSSLLYEWSPGKVTSGTLCGVRIMWVFGVCVAFLGVVLRIPLRGLFICPLAVAGLEARYLCTVCKCKCGAPSRKPALIALMIDVMGGLRKLWCANLTLLIFVVRVYENPAISTMVLRWARPKQGPGRGWVGNWWWSVMCALWGRGITGSGVVFPISSLMMGRVHKSVGGSLYPLKIILVL